MTQSLFTLHDRRPLVMGIVNVTPDSFYPDSRVDSEGAALRRAEDMVAAGADILDIGGESTRPGSAAVDAAEEERRVVPVLRALAERFLGRADGAGDEAARRSLQLSVDTRKAAVARAALDAGAVLVNDVSGLRDDPDMLPLVAERGVLVCIMHMQGSPDTMQKDPRYRDPVTDIRDDLARRVDAALAAGVRDAQIILDPGIGFGKTVRDNLALIARLGEIRSLGYPVLMGISRKSFVGRVLATGGGPDDLATGDTVTTEQAPPVAAPSANGAGRFEAIDRVEPRPVEERLAGTLGATAAAIAGGADILRVHDVAETADLVTVMRAVSGEATTEP